MNKGDVSAIAAADIPATGLQRSSAAKASERCPLFPGEFNWSVQHQSQSIGRGFEAQGHARALIEPQSDRVEVGFDDGRHREYGRSRRACRRATTMMQELSLSGCRLGKDFLGLLL
jgi:hypothetical protein